MSPKPKKGSKKGSKKGKKKKKKIVEDAKVVRELVLAAEAGDLSKLRTLVDAPENKKKYDWAGTAADALVRAAEKGHAHVVTYVIEQGVKPGWGSGRPLHRAVQSNNLAVVKALINAGIDVNVKTSFTEQNSLHYAAQRGLTEMVAFLHMCGANLDAVCHGLNNGVYNGWGAMHFAADAGYLDIVRYLVDSMATIDLLTAEKETPAAIAAEHGHFPVVRHLVAHGAGVDAKRRELSLFQWAVYRADSETVQYLVSYGATPDLDVKALWFPDGLTLHQLIKKEFSAPVYDRIDVAIYRGKKGMRERVSHKRILSELRWESPVYYDPMSFEGPPPPEILQFPPSIVALISSFE